MVLGDANNNPNKCSYKCSVLMMLLFECHAPNTQNNRSVGFAYEIWYEKTSACKTRFPSAVSGTGLDTTSPGANTLRMIEVVQLVLAL